MRHTPGPLLQRTPTFAGRLRSSGLSPAVSTLRCAPHIKRTCVVSATSASLGDRPVLDGAVLATFADAPHFRGLNVTVGHYTDPAFSHAPIASGPSRRRVFRRELIFGSRPSRRSHRYMSPSPLAVLAIMP